MWNTPATSSNGFGNNDLRIGDDAKTWNNYTPLSSGGGDEVSAAVVVVVLTG